MAALWAGHYILQMRFLSFFFFFFFPRLSQRSQIGCLPYFYTWCGISANLECRSEMCCTRLAENTGRKNHAKNHHCTSLSGYIFATKACIDNQKNLLNSDISSTCPHNDELRPTNGWDQLASLGHPNKSQRVSRLGFVTVPTLLNGGQPNFTRCLAVFWAGTLYILGALARCKINFASKSYVLLYWQRYCTALEHYATRRPSRSTLGGRTV